MDDYEQYGNFDSELAEINEKKKLCDTPDVDEAYLVELRLRIANFNDSIRLSSNDEEARRLAYEKIAAANRARRVTAIKTGEGTILDTVSTFFGIDYKSVLDGVLDSDEYINLLSCILSPFNRSAIIVSYPILPPPPTESGRIFAEDSPHFRRIVITDGSTVPMNSRSLVICKPNKATAIEYTNLFEELMFVPLEGEAEKTILLPLEDLLNRLCCDHLRITTRWGEIMKSPQGAQTRSSFLGQLEAFERFLETTDEDLQKKPEFYVPDEIMSQVLNLKDERHIYQDNPQLFYDIESFIQFIYKKIELILLEGDKVQASRDDVGPRAELEYWRSRLTTLTAINDFAQSPPLEKCLALTRVSVSPSVKSMRILKEQIVISVNEAIDNVNYLHNFDRLSQTLYTNDPPTLAKPLQDLLYCVRMVFSSSRYFNTTERITAMLVKITNQLVIRCKAYLTDDGEISIWSLTHEELIKRIAGCIDLYYSYKQSFNEVDAAMKENPKERQFGCSEANVFVRLTTFIERLDKIRDVVQLNLNFSVLHSSCIEGISKLAAKFDTALRQLVTKPYNPLDERKMDFVNDYAEYKSCLKEYEVELRVFCTNLIESTPTVGAALAIIQRLEDLKLPSLCIDLDYVKQLDKLYAEMGAIMDLYNEQRAQIRLTKGMPQFGGRIAWIRSLMAKIIEPMEIFMKKENIIRLPHAQPCIRRYNRLLKVFVVYEMVHHEEWCKDMERVEHLLHICVFSFATDGALKTNWHPFIREQMRETKTMKCLRLPVPDEGFILHSNRSNLLPLRQRIYKICDIYNQLRRSIPEIYLQLMRPLLYELDLIIDSGIIELSWSSVGLTAFYEASTAKLEEIQGFLNKLRDIKRARIDEQVEAISMTNFVDMELDEPITLYEFKARQANHRKKVLKDLNTRIVCAEDGAIEIINLFVDTLDVPKAGDIKYQWLNINLIALDEEHKTHEVLVSPEWAFFRWEKPKDQDLPAFQRSCMKLYSHFHQQILNALYDSMLRSMKTFVDGVMRGNKQIIKANLYLEIPNVKIRPTMFELQSKSVSFSKNALSLLGELNTWAARSHPELSPEALRTKNAVLDYYKIVGEDKEIIRLCRSLPGLVLLYSETIENIRQGFMKFSFLWDQDRHKHFNDFLEPDPPYLTIEDEMRRVSTFSQDVKNLSEVHNINILRVFTGMCKNL